MILSHHEPNPFKGTQHLRERRKLYDEVNVLMRAGLFAEERIYPPPSVEPHSEWDSLEGIEDAENVGSFHRLIVYQARLQFARTVRPCRMPVLWRHHRHRHVKPVPVSFSRLFLLPPTLSRWRSPDDDHYRKGANNGSSLRP